MTYRIKDYDKHFETNRTRSFKHCGRVTFPNDLNIPERMQLLKGESGPANLAVWISIVQWVTAQSWPREGYLTDNTRADGNPLDCDDLAQLISIPRAAVKGALERLIDKKIGWMEIITDGRSAEDADTLPARSAYVAPISTPNHSKPSHSEKDILKNALSSDACAENSEQGNLQANDFEEPEPEPEIEGENLGAYLRQAVEDQNPEQGNLQSNQADEETRTTNEEMGLLGDIASAINDSMLGTEGQRLLTWMRNPSNKTTMLIEYGSSDCFWHVVKQRYQDIERAGSIENPAHYFVTGIVSSTDPYLLKQTAIEEQGLSYVKQYNQERS